MSEPPRSEDLLVRYGSQYHLSKCIALFACFYLSSRMDSYHIQIIRSTDKPKESSVHSKEFVGKDHRLRGFSQLVRGGIKNTIHDLFPGIQFSLLTCVLKMQTGRGTCGAAHGNTMCGPDHTHLTLHHRDSSEMPQWPWLQPAAAARRATPFAFRRNCLSSNPAPVCSSAANHDQVSTAACRRPPALQRLSFDAGMV